MGVRVREVAAGPGAAQPRIVDVIRDAIRQRLLPPGMPLVQATLAEALGVSRIPVREALHYLASEGLVTFGEDGAQVTALTPDEVHELWSLRAVLESAMADAIVRHARPDDLDELRRLVGAMDEAEDADRWSDLNYLFHSAMYRIARLPHYAGAASRVLTLIEPYSRVAVNRLKAQPDAQREHHEMVAALERGDREALRDVLERSSLRARKLLVDFAEGRNDAPASAGPTAEAARAFASRLLGPAGDE